MKLYSINEVITSHHWYIATQSWLKVYVSVSPKNTSIPKYMSKHTVVIKTADFCKLKLEKGNGQMPRETNLISYINTSRHIPSTCIYRTTRRHNGYNNNYYYALYPPLQCQSSSGKNVRMAIRRPRVQIPGWNSNYASSCKLPHLSPKHAGLFGRIQPFLFPCHDARIY